MSRLHRLFAREKLLLQQSRELARLREEVSRLRSQNEKINRAMRRCLTCDYRLDALTAPNETSSAQES